MATHRIRDQQYPHADTGGTDCADHAPPGPQQFPPHQRREPGKKGNYYRTARGRLRCAQCRRKAELRAVRICTTRRLRMHHYRGERIIIVLHQAVIEYCSYCDRWPPHLSQR